ncbi:Calcyphosin-2 [Chelonia mydas]|uniref:Calcyphosin-2 n=1 Tax=Chelonia mydas TaxID=8469 RepID=M7ALY4_CHEMY|nr:Calcyphosin-2 [Chelonia mydas]
MKEGYKQYSQRTAEKKKNNAQSQESSRKTAHKKDPQLEDRTDHDLTALDEKALLQQCYTSKPYTMQHSIRKLEAEDVAAERRKQTVVEQVMVDQLSRAVISDPEQSTNIGTYQRDRTFADLGTAPLRFRKRTLHETKIRTRSALTENVLSNKLRFDGRILSSLPESIKQNPILTLRVTNIDEAAMDILKVHSSPMSPPLPTPPRWPPSRVHSLALPGLGHCSSSAGRSRLPEAPESQSVPLAAADFESLWLILDDNCNDEVDYGEFTRAIIGEMNEYRKAFVRKAYMKLDFNKTGSIPMVDIRKCYCAKKHSRVLSDPAAKPGEALDQEKPDLKEGLGLPGVPVAKEPGSNPGQREPDAEWELELPAAEYPDELEGPEGTARETG